MHKRLDLKSFSYRLLFHMVIYLASVYHSRQGFDGKTHPKQGLPTCVLLRHLGTNIFLLWYSKVFCPIDKGILLPLIFFLEICAAAYH